MLRSPLVLGCFVPVIIFLVSSCNSSPEFEIAWTKDMPKLGTGSSPKCVDLNLDGILDVVMGAGTNENEASDSSVLALDGKTGHLLWAAHAEDQIVGSATFLDITNDNVPEVFIGGRNFQFMCINGSSGEVLWRFHPSKKDSIHACCFRFNFFNSQIIKDIDHDQSPDLLISNGGNPLAKPFSAAQRFPGVLAIMSSKTGNVIVADTMPDGKETYMSPVVYDFEKNGNPMIVFGTGGETLGGNLFKVSLNDLIRGDISKAKILAQGDGYGFIAPPTLADINEDGTKDVIVNWFGGKMMAIDGKNDSLIWERPVHKTETYSVAVPGYFNGDSTPDFFSLYNKGAWPNNKGSIQLMVNGKNGSVLYTDSLGCIGYSSAVTTDINDDDYDEVIFSVNDFFCDPPAIMGEDILNDNHSLRLLDFYGKRITPIGENVRAKNISSTPWLGDLDADGFLDIIYCTQRNQLKVDQYNGLTLERLKTNIRVASTPTWGSYMGEGSNGVLECLNEHGLL